MRNPRTLIIVLSVLCLAAALPIQAEAADSLGEICARNLEGAADHAVQLVEAIPAEDYGWRPMEGVRSVSEAAMHMAGANYFFASLMGTPVPEGVDPRAMGSITDKDEVVAALKASLDHLHAALLAVEDPSAEVDLFGNPGTVADAMLIVVGHVHEHLGQLIAYARSNEVVPPWSQSAE